VLRSAEQLSCAAAFERALAQPIAQIGGNRSVKAAQAEITADAQRLSALRLPAARRVEEQHWRQVELTR